MKKAESQEISHRQKPSQAKRCHICGSVLKVKQGCCVSCGTILDDSELPKNYVMKPMVPIERLLFVHLDVESGKMSYIESKGEDKLSGEFNLKEGGLE